MLVTNVPMNNQPKILPVRRTSPAKTDVALSSFIGTAPAAFDVVPSVLIRTAPFAKRPHH
jgi:hypothetical protein